MENPHCQPSSDAFSDLLTVKIDSCHCTWYFQPVRGRFRRVLKGPGLDGVATGWRDYYGLRFDQAVGTFTVLINKEGTRLLGARCHRPGDEGCPRCAAASADATVDTVPLVERCV